MNWLKKLFRRKSEVTVANAFNVTGPLDKRTQLQMYDDIHRIKRAYISAYGTRSGHIPPRVLPAPAPAPLASPAPQPDNTLTNIALFAALTNHDSSPPKSAPCAAPAFSSGGGGDYGGGGASGSWDSGGSSSSYSSSDSGSSSSSDSGSFSSSSD